MTKMQVLAPAKINLSLRVLGRRADDFHEIETLIVPIALHDVLTIERQSRWIDFVCDDRSLPQNDQNLVVRAAKSFLATTKARGGVKISLQKKIPHGAGLGGGSSDAAAILLALNQLFGTKLSPDELVSIGSEIGSDVPFFLNESPALCKGRGEIVTTAKVKERLFFLLFKPSFGVSSKWAYSRWQTSREIPGVDYCEQKLGDKILVNDLERPVFQKFVFLAQLKSWLRQQPEVDAALMSGSGSTVFAVTRPNADRNGLARRAREELDRELWSYNAETL